MWGRNLRAYSRSVDPVERDAAPTQGPTVFYPPLAMQQSVWDSIVNGNFIDAKIFAFSRRSREPGRVDAPKPLFVNTHVLGAACGYFRSTFDFSNGVETALNAGPPPGVEHSFDVEECDSDSDFDDPVEEPHEGYPVESRPSADPADPGLPERIVKAYVVQYTAYRTLRAIIWYIYSGEIVFSPSDSPDIPSASAKSIYRFADEHNMGDLKKLAFEAITSTIDRLSSSELIEEALSVFTSRYPEFHGHFLTRFRKSIAHGPPESESAFQSQLSRYFSGELPHSREFLTSLLNNLVDWSTIPLHELSENRNPISRVPHPWPGRTKEALRISLDKGNFDDLHFTTTSGSSPGCLVYFSRAADEGIGSPFLHFWGLPPAHQHEIKASLSAWRAVAYYMYTDCVNFEPVGSKDAEPSPALSPSDTLFQGYTCSPTEVLYLARKLAACDALLDLVADEIIPTMTPQNVVDKMFCGPSPPLRVIGKGVKIIHRLRRKRTSVPSQLQGILQEAASGGRSGDVVAFSAVFEKLFRPPPYIGADLSDSSDYSSSSG